MSVLIVKGVSFKKKYARKGNAIYERPKNKNLVDHTEPNSSVK